MEWYNPPPYWTSQGESVNVRAGAKTDFWRKTHNGLIRDNGHFYYRPVTGDFTAQVKFSGRYTALYDQAGLMLRVDAANWLKCGIELVDSIQHVSAVVTRDYSDWSVVPLPQSPPTLWLRVSRQGTTVEVHYALDGTNYTLLRTAYLTSTDRVGVGLMCASPEGDGFPVTFEGLTIDNR